jgi:hypothetical protein
VLAWQFQRLEPVAAAEGIEVIGLDTSRPNLVALAETAIRSRFVA